VIENWLPVPFQSIPLSFQLDFISWPFVFGFVVLLFSVILTSSTQLQNRSSPWILAGSIGIVAIGLLALQASNPLTLILTWALLDLVELYIEITLGEKKDLIYQAVLAYFFRTAGVLLAIFGMLFSRSQGIFLTFTSIPAQAGLILMLAVGLRLGVIPLHLPFIQESQTRRGLGDVLRMASPVSSFVLLARLPETLVQQEIAPLIILLSAWAALYASARWLAAPDELSGRPFWLISLASLSVVCVAQGNPAASRAWGTVMLTSGAGLFLYSAREGKLWIFPALGLLAMSGLPFTPAASGWSGIFSPGWKWYNLTFIFSYALLLSGYLRHLFREGDRLSHLERWIQVVYPAGLGLVVVAGWVLGVLGWRGSFTPGITWAGIVTAALFLLFTWLMWLFQREKVRSNLSLVWLRQAFINFSGYLEKVFSLNWLYWLFQQFYAGLERLISVITVVLEGDGGVLWAMIMLALLISLIGTITQ
jgi:hypothetical protein